MPNPSIEDVLREYDREKGRSSSSGSDTSWGDYVFGRDRGLSSLITGEDDSEPGLFGRATKWYKETPWAGKPFGWVDRLQDINKRGEEALTPYVGKTAAKVASLPARANTFGAEMFFGSPADVASTAASLPSLGTSLVPTVGPKLLAKAPAIVGKVAPYAGKALKYTGKAADALQSMYMGSEAVEQAKKGNYGTALMNAGGSVLSGAGTVGYGIPTPRAGNTIDLADEIAATRKPSFLQSDPKFANRPVTRAAVTTEPLPGKTVTIEGTVKGEKAPKVAPIGDITTAPARKAFKTEEDYLTALVDYNARRTADAELIRTSQEPLRYTRPVTAPNAITDPARLLPEKSGLPATPPSNIRASVVHPNDVWLNRKGNNAMAGEAGLSDRAIADLTAAGEEINARNMERYLQIDAYRNGVQARADAVGKPGGYEATVDSGRVTPATAAPDYPTEIAPETQRLLDAVKGKVDDDVAARTISAVYKARQNAGAMSDPDYGVAMYLYDALSPSDLAVARSIGLLDESHLSAVDKVQAKAKESAVPELPTMRGETAETLEAPRVEDALPESTITPDVENQGDITWRADTRTEKPYRYGDNPKLDGQMKSKVQRVLKGADKELVAITDPAERRVRLVEILGEKLNRNELGAAFEGGILNQKLVREATENRISRGIEENPNVRYTPPLDVTPNIGPPNQMPPPGFAGRAVEGPTATGPMYWNQQSPEPISVTEGTFAGAAPTTPPQVSGLRQVMAEPGLASRPVMRTEADVVEALAKRGVTEPTPEMIQKVMSDPALLDKIVPGTSEFVPDVSRGFTPMNRPVETDASKLIPERVPVQTDADRIMTPEQATAAIEKARAAKPRDIYGDNDWERAQEVMKNLGHEDLANAVGAASNYVKSHQLGVVEDARKSGGMSMETELQRLGNSGDEIVLLKRQANADANRRASGYWRGVADEVDALSGERFSKIAEWLDGDKTVKLSPAEIATAEKMKEVLKRSGQDQVDRGMLSKGAVTEYWPRRWDGIPEKTIEDAMRAKNMSADEIARNLEFIRNNREMKTAGEYNRSGNNVPGFRLDKDVFFDHLKEVARRVELVDRFGLKDTADPNSAISKLIAQTSNPDRARDLAERMLRGGPSGTENSKKAANAVRNYMQTSMLQLSAISNLLGGATSVAFRSDLKSAGEALFKVFQSNSPEMKFMKDVNRFNEFKAGMAEGLTDSRWFGKFKYGINETQNQINKYAGATGLGTAKSLFQELKAKPGDKDIGWLLQDLVHERPATLLKQTELTPAQLERAMYRMADLTQGFMQNEKLPYAWVRTGLPEIPQIFQRINFMTTKALKDGVMHSPMNRGGKLGAIGKLGALGIGLGEAINIGKEIPRTVGEVGFNEIQQATGYSDEDKEFGETLKENLGYGEKGIDANRFYQTRRWISGINEKAGKNEPLVRAVNNLESSFAVGMPLNLLAMFSSTFLAEKNKDPGGTALNNMFAAVDEGGKLIGQGVDVAHQLIRPAWGEEADWRDTARFVTRRLPIVGGVQHGVVRDIDSSAQSKRSGSQSIWGNPEDFR